MTSVLGSARRLGVHRGGYPCREIYIIDDGSSEVTGDPPALGRSGSAQVEQSNFVAYPRTRQPTDAQRSKAAAHIVLGPKQNRMGLCRFPIKLPACSELSPKTT